MSEVEAFVGLGANLGPAAATLDAAFSELAGLPQTRLVARSSLWRSEPVDAGGDDYVNAVAEIRTALAATDLLAALQAIELDHGRERPYRNAPRTLDLDLLLYGRDPIDQPALVVPHPRLHQRAFVLAPLAEIAPELDIPGHGPVAVLLAAVSGQRVDRLCR